MKEDILARIAAYKRQEVAARRAALSDSALADKVASATPPRGFRAALQAARAPGRLPLIAEVKKASPSKGLIRADFDPVAIARAYAQGGATCLSVLTDAPSFQGADENLALAREASALPVLRKDFLVDAWQVGESRALGADAILVILAMVDDPLAANLIGEASRLGMDALVETHDVDEIERAEALGADMIGINNRDLRTFVTDLSVTERLAEKIPASALIITESGIFSPADAARLERAGAGAMLVGESLMRQADLAAATRALVGEPQRST
ncbi:MAG TPA: indole-3-glycerol phosphate synthase TrpC [Caulobacteraceae bacterium]|nr:indole-3-glycerol phosphate synthase TrpC [Caulobacteraceae bacterium]